MIDERRPCRSGSLALLFALVVCALAAPGNLIAQAFSVKGRVIDGATAAPLSDATVTLLGTKQAARTDANGEFNFSNISPGRYEVEARRLGSTTARETVFLRDGSDVAVVLRLSLVTVNLVGIEVIGSAAAKVERLPGSVSVVRPAEIALRQPTSANEILRSMPGVHIQEEEGAGLRVNVGIRGLDPDRSRALLVLEDGVPVALAPYGEPEMYYSPPIDRMERVELVKGSGSILFGPQTIGGVLNYVTADAPSEATGFVRVRAGGHGSRWIKGSYGGSWRTARGAVSVLDSRAETATGLRYDVRDVTGKLGLRTAVGDFGVKSSVYREGSNSTYVGLTESMFRADPFQHPAPDDRLEIRREALTVSHEAGRPGLSARTNVYAYHTARDWRRQDYGYTTDSSAHVFAGTAGNRNREFHVIGVEPRLRTTWRGFGSGAELEAGIRLHYERARDAYVQSLTATGTTGALRDDETRHGRAVAAFAQNRFFFGTAWQLTPGVRLESFSYDRNVTRTRVRRQTSAGTTRLPEDVDLRTGDSMLEVIPGIGALWAPSVSLSIFAGAHRGFAPPRVKDAIVYSDTRVESGQLVAQLRTLSLDAERSVNYELGVRMSPRSWASVEVTGFRLDFTNQIVTPSLSGGAVSQLQLANQGATTHSGAEAAVTLDFAKAMGQPFGLVGQLSATAVRAVFSRDRFLATPAGFTVNVRGNDLPYAPRLTVSGSITYAPATGLEARMDALYVGAQFADNFETVAPSPTGRNGRIPAYRVYDLSLRYALPAVRTTVSAAVKNLFAAEYVASRRPEGIKPGMPRTVTAAIALTF